MSTTDKYLELWKVLAASPVVGLEILAPVGEYQRVTLVTEDNVRVTFLLAGQYDERYLDVVIEDPDAPVPGLRKFGQV